THGAFRRGLRSLSSRRAAVEATAVTSGRAPLMGRGGGDVTVDLRPRTSPSLLNVPPPHHHSASTARRDVTGAPAPPQPPRSKAAFVPMPCSSPLHPSVPDPTGAKSMPW